MEHFLKVMPASRTPCSLSLSLCLSLSLFLSPLSQKQFSLAALIKMELAEFSGTFEILPCFSSDNLQT